MRQLTYVLTILIQKRAGCRYNQKRITLVGFNWSEELYSSDYFQQLYLAISMIKKWKSLYSQSSEDMAAQKELQPKQVLMVPRESFY
jgi:hypothetical protein